MIMVRDGAEAARDSHKVEVEGSIPSPAKKRYERLGQLLIRPLVLRGEQSAYDLARLYYAQYTDLDFEKDFEDYCRNGFVAVRPHLFAMVKPIKHKGEDAWFVRCVIGSLVEAITTLPCLLPKVVFCRNNNPNKLVACDTQRLIEIAQARAKRNGWRTGN